MTPRIHKLSFAVITLALVLAAMTPTQPSDLRGQFDSPVMAMYMSENLSQVHELVPASDTEQYRKLTWRWRRFLIVDLAFLAAYGWMFFEMARQLARLTHAGILAMVLAPAAAVADLGENTAIWFALSGSAFWAGLIKPFSLTKWGLIGAIALLLSWLFKRAAPLDTEEKLVSMIAGVFYLLTAVIAAFGLWQHYVLERVLTPLSLAILLQAYLGCLRRIFP